MIIKNNKNNNKIVVILGPTASGKTGLAVKLAYKFNGEIVSADSRQVYRGMDIGTGKDLGEYLVKGVRHHIGCRTPYRIPCHLIDVVNPNTKFSLAKYQKLAYKAIDDILQRGKLPIIAGGTGLYLQAVVDGYKLSKVKPDKKLRGKLEKLSASELFKKLQKLNAGFADRLHESDKKNQRRLIRYIEICKDTECPTRLAEAKGEAQVGHSVSGADYDILLIGLTWPREVLRERIYKRLIKRLEKEDMIGEVERLHKQGVTWKRLESFGLEYKYVSLYLRKKLDYKEMIEKLNIAIRQFAKKQMSWFRRWERHGAKIYWIEDRGEAEKLIKVFKRK